MHGRISRLQGDLESSRGVRQEDVSWSWYSATSRRGRWVSEIAGTWKIVRSARLEQRTGGIQLLYQSSVQMYREGLDTDVTSGAIQELYVGV